MASTARVHVSEVSEALVERIDALTPALKASGAANEEDKHLSDIVTLYSP